MRFRFSVAQPALPHKIHKAQLHIQSTSLITSGQIVCCESSVFAHPTAPVTDEHHDVIVAQRQHVESVFSTPPRDPFVEEVGTGIQHVGERKEMALTPYLEGIGEIPLPHQQPTHQVQLIRLDGINRALFDFFDLSQIIAQRQNFVRLGDNGLNWDLRLTVLLQLIETRHIPCRLCCTKLLATDVATEVGNGHWLNCSEMMENELHSHLVPHANVLAIRFRYGGLQSHLHHLTHTEETALRTS